MPPLSFFTVAACHSARLPDPPLFGVHAGDTEVCAPFDPLFPQHSLLGAPRLYPSHASGKLLWVKEGSPCFPSAVRPPFNNLSNLQLTALKVSYDLIRTDYGDNSITHNHVGKLNTRLRIWSELDCWKVATRCFLFACAHSCGVLCVLSFLGAAELRFTSGPD